MLKVRMLLYKGLWRLGVNICPREIVNSINKLVLFNKKFHLFY
nr:MAG TPA: hypothetical protein [Herelleviridae sp.]